MSNNYSCHKTLKNLGYDILILDHHNAPYYSEDAIVINNQLSENYSNKDLSGVGVVYKFFEYFENEERKKSDDECIAEGDPIIWNYVDLVALGEISDMCSMTSLENRFICDSGLAFIRN